LRAAVTAVATDGIDETEKDSAAEKVEICGMGVTAKSA
jgi:hypothetical protein